MTASLIMDLARAMEHPHDAALAYLVARGGQCELEALYDFINRRRGRAEPVVTKLYFKGIIVKGQTEGWVYLVDGALKKLARRAAAVQGELLRGPEPNVAAAVVAAATRNPELETRNEAAPPGHEATEPPVACQPASSGSSAVLESNPVDPVLETKNSLSRLFESKSIEGNWRTDPYLSEKLSSRPGLRKELLAGETGMARNFEVLYRQRPERARELVGIAVLPATQKPGAWLNACLAAEFAAGPDSRSQIANSK